MLFAPPELDADDLRVVCEIDDARTRLRYHLRSPRRWKGQLRRNLKARAIRGSNSIEGYEVSLDDALAILDDDEPLDADRRTELEIIGYRNAMTYIMQLVCDPVTQIDQSLLRSLHFMMLGHDLDKSPGQYRQKAIYVHDEESNEIVYEGPDPELVPALMAELVAAMASGRDQPVYVRAALAHLNLVMVHPFRDGNGRMARALQTFVLGQDQILTPEFSSIEEWLGRNTTSYYDALAEVGAGSWHPERNTHSWVRFNLTAHHMQAQTVLRRVDDSVRIWAALEGVTERLNLPERVMTALYDATTGYRIRRSSYARDADLEPGTAARDLRILVKAGLLVPKGETRGRFYVAGEELRSLRAEVARGRRPVIAPYGAINARG